jgi:hypothetical protein
MVLPPFAAVGLPRRNQPHDLAAHGVGDRINPPLNAAEGEPPFLAVGAARLLGVQPARIKKDARGIIEGKALFGIFCAAFGSSHSNRSIGHCNAFCSTRKIAQIKEAGGLAHYGRPGKVAVKRSWRGERETGGGAVYPAVSRPVAGRRILARSRFGLPRTGYAGHKTGHKNSVKQLRQSDGSIA